MVVFFYYASSVYIIYIYVKNEFRPTLFFNQKPWDYLLFNVRSPGHYFISGLAANRNFTQHRLKQK